MNSNQTARSKRVREDAGIALITTILLLLLMSSLLVGFSVLLYTDLQLSGASDDQVRAFYGAEAGMEQMTAKLGNLFSQNYSPSIAQINAISATPPVLQEIQFLKGDGTSGYSITPQSFDANGNPAATIATIKSGAYQGMTAMATEYTLLVNSRTVTGKEVTLRRTTQTVGIPMFQFGLFCDMDCSFFAGPNFNFGGRMHTNGNLWLASGSTLTMSDKVDAYKDVIRTNLSNGFPTGGAYAGTVSITTSPGSGTYRALGLGEGSLVGTLGSGPDPNWGLISLGSTNYAGNLINGKGSAFPNASTGAKQLNLGIVTIGNGATQAIDIIRRPKAGESATVTGERYFAQASLKILLSDNPNDIMNLPCIDGSTQPLDLSQLAQPVANWPASAPYSTLKANLGAAALPLAWSGAKTTSQNNYAVGYQSADGYWLPYRYPIIKGFIKIEAQISYGTPCGTWKDVTVEILSLGYVGKNINPQAGLVAGQYGTPTAGAGAPLYSAVPVPTTGASVAVGPQVALNVPCGEPHLNAVIRLERVRDNPSTYPAAPPCGTVSTTSPPSDFWPNTIFDAREGSLRDFAPGAPGAAINLNPTLNGVMHYIELDAKNLARWFGGQIGATGPSTKDAVNSPYNFVVYISDRRGNYLANQTWAGNWPPLSPTTKETGEYGWTDFVNPNNALTGCTDNALDSGEDLDGLGLLFNYGADDSWILYQNNNANNAPPLATDYGRYGIYTVNMLGAGATNALNPNPTCATPGYSTNAIWPMVYATSANAARENPPLFFRRAVKVVDGNLLTAVGACPSGVSCGLTIATENPVYVQGDFNANSAGGGWNDPGIATSIAADAITLLSDNWNDVNSFSGRNNVGGAAGNVGIYGQTYRNGGTAWYRAAVIAGKGVSFPQPAGTGQDFGTDGGVHNFLRYIETWGGTLNYRGSLVSLYYNRQATGIFKCCTTVYNPPARGYNFDTTFLNPTLLPPRTPLFRDVNTTGFTRLMLPGQYQ
jgi:hypothetical protein